MTTYDAAIIKRELWLIQDRLDALEAAMPATVAPPLEEPTGLGAVVRDGAQLWARARVGAPGTVAWYACGGGWTDWASLKDPCIVSDGFNGGDQ